MPEVAEKPAKGEQMELIETEHPDAAEFLKLGRQIRRLDAERGEIQEKRDKVAAKLRDLFHSAKPKIKVFRRAEIVIELKDVEEKVSVKGRPGTERVEQ